MVKTTTLDNDESKQYARLKVGVVFEKRGLWNMTNENKISGCGEFHKGGGGRF